MPEELLIIGGVAAGLSAAGRARRLNPRARITVVEQGPVCSYSACGLPLALAGRVPMQRLILHPAEYFRTERKIDVLTGCRALEIEPARRRVRVESDSSERWLPFDHLVLATGATSRWRPDGAGLRHVYAANTWAQVEMLLMACAGPESPRRIAIVGGGYIGLEVAEALARRQRAVILVEQRPALLDALDPELSAPLSALASAAGIEVRTGVRVLALEGAGRVRALATSDGEIAADAVINCAGLRPRVALAAAAGVPLGSTGGVRVDDRQQTSLAGIYAAGDCAEAHHRVSGAPTWVPLAPAAVQQGRVAGHNAAGGPPARFPGVLGTLVVPLFDREWGCTGLGLETARAAGFGAEAVQIEAATRAGYLDPAPVVLRLIFDRRSRRLLGCQIQGPPGTVVGRLNTVAAALTAGLRLEDVEMLENAYAPPVAPVIEPLAIAARQALRAGAEMP